MVYLSERCQVLLNSRVKLKYILHRDSLTWLAIFIMVFGVLMLNLTSVLFCKEGNRACPVHHFQIDFFMFKVTSTASAHLLAYIYFLETLNELYYSLTLFILILQCDFFSDC